MAYHAAFGAGPKGPLPRTVGEGVAWKDAKPQFAADQGPIILPGGMHIYIFGNSGAGKSTLAKRIRRKEGMAHIDLDEFAWKETVGDRRDVEEASSCIRSRLRTGPTVVEGCYSDLIDALIREDDQLFWLDLSLEECIKHCKMRPFEAHKWESAEMQDAFLPQLLGWLGSYSERDDPMGRIAHLSLYESFKGNKRRILSEDEAASFSRTGA